MTGQSTRQPPWEEDQAHETASFGAWLRSQRKIREVPLGEIADATKISIRYLQALEQDRFDVLPAAVFAKGFLREYARFVGLDPDEVVNSYLIAQQASLHTGPGDQTEPAEPSRRQRKNNWFLIVALLVALALIAFLIYWGGSQSREEAIAPPSIAAPVLPPAPPRPVEENARAPTALTVTMDFSGDCWVEASVDGRRRISQLHVQGESMRLEADEEVLLTLGNPQGVRLEVNGEPYPLPALDGQVVRNLVIRSDR